MVTFRSTKSLQLRSLNHDAESLPLCHYGNAIGAEHGSASQEPPSPRGKRAHAGTRPPATGSLRLLLRLDRISLLSLNTGSRPDSTPRVVAAVPVNEILTPSHPYVVA